MDESELDTLQEECLLYRNSTETVQTIPRSDPLLYWSKVSQNGNFSTLVKLVKGVLSLPHGNADVERLFSSMNNTKSPLRNRLGDATLTSMLVIKTNNPANCYQFEPTKEMINKAKSATYQHLQSAAAAKATPSIAEQPTTSSSKSTRPTRAKETPKNLVDYMCI